MTRYQRPVYNLLAQMLRHPGLAEELAQETFLRAFSNLQSYDPRFRFINWILRIAHNLAIDTLRRRAPLEVSLDDPVAPDAPPRAERVADPHADTSREAEQGQLARALDAALARLRPEYRRLVVLRYHDDLSYEDLSAITGLPLGTVKSYLHRARVEMARHLTEAGWGRTGALQPPAGAGRRT